ncbi:cyclic nucleotide-gated ion channel 1 isoform X1 [Ziziphus jujuba]|uniref:Cyclic nucleotide-gated ion channel 1 isoform X1 n=1 Tax=Ziziphus jujuba TaxID=326968 RepID=A0ABM3ID28_ZIZJJ|nr:cyclic nucleotide-gated ion channel 1 isoform X1 [Ziziphus jujuba]
MDNNKPVEVVRIQMGNFETIFTKKQSSKQDVSFMITSSANSSKELRTKIKEILRSDGQYLPILKKVFLVSCVIAITLDPLFLYVPYINERKKCLEMDQTLKIVALVLRCCTDISYLIYIIFHTRNGFQRKAARALATAQKSGFIGKAEAISWRIPWSLMLIDIPAILPLPQVIIVVFFTKMWGSRYSSKRKFLNFLVVFQYVPRVLRIYRSCKKLGTIPSSLIGLVWKGSFNLLLYIIASHVLGAWWYFLSVEREAECWLKACKNHGGCAAASFDCNDKTYSTASNLTILNEFCPINPPNADDFGIYLDGILSGVVSSTDFPKKLVQCFWWGLRNLSSFGQNLKTSNNVLETCFAALILITGLLLFLYLIGNLQTYMQLATARSEEIRQKMKTKEPEIDLWISSSGIPENEKTVVMQQIQYALEHEKDVDFENLLRHLSLYHKDSLRKGNLSLDELRKTYMKLAATRSEEKRQQTRMKERKAELWILRNGIPRDLKPIIMQHTRYRLTDNKEVDVQSLLSLLPLEHRKAIKEHLCLDVLKKVPILQNMDEKVFEHFIDFLKPVVYSENSYIIREGEPLDLMLFITHGIALTFTTSSNGGTGSKCIQCLQKRDIFGEELLNWTLKFASFTDLPISTTNVKAHTKVEAFVLTANDSKTLVTSFWWLFRKQLRRSTKSELKRLEPFALSAVKEARRSVKKSKESLSTPF